MPPTLLDRMDANESMRLNRASTPKETSQFQVKSPRVGMVKDMFIVRGRVAGDYDETLGVFPFNSGDDESRNRARYLAHAFVELIHELESSH